MQLKATAYYDSKVRSRRYGTSCGDCRKTLDVGTMCKRAYGGTNDRGFAIYFETCFKCWKKLLPKEILKAEKGLKQYIKHEKDSIKVLKAFIKKA